MFFTCQFHCRKLYGNEGQFEITFYSGITNLPGLRQLVIQYTLVHCLSVGAHDLVTLQTQGKRVPSLVYDGQQVIERTDLRLVLEEKGSTVKPLNTADLGTGKKAAVFRKRQYWESYI